MQGLTGKVALITGAGRGLGAAISQNLAAAGVTVVCADIREDLAQEVARHVEQADGRARALRLDVSRWNEAQRTIEDTLAACGQLDILINNAGIDVTVAADALTVEHWERIIATNLSGPFLMAKAVLPAMKRQGGGHIVNITSTAAKRAWANAAAYHASKWGLLGLSHALHAELRSFNIKVTAVVCGGMRTPFLLDRFPDIDVSTLQDPRNVAETVRFVLAQPRETVIPEIMVLPVTETSWP
jgi:NAD(P)-dependent dehydrogenase (short-subunit alcohol dehydrogenase family)